MDPISRKCTLIVAGFTASLLLLRMEAGDSVWCVASKCTVVQNVKYSPDYYVHFLGNANVGAVAGILWSGFVRILKALEKKSNFKALKVLQIDFGP